MAEQYKFIGTYRWLRWLCFALLGGLAGWHIRREPIPAIVLALAFVALVIVGLTVLRWALVLSNPRVRKEQGGQAIAYAIGRGYLLMLPFATLATFAELYLQWDAAQAFAAAGLMTAGTAVGAEMARLGGNRFASLLLPTLSSFVMSGLWIFLSRAVALGWRPQ